MNLIPGKPHDVGDVEQTVRNLKLAVMQPDLKLEHCGQLHAVASATIELAKLAAKRRKDSDETVAMLRESKVAQLLIKRRWGLLINEAEQDNRTRVRGLAPDLGIHATELIRLRMIGQMQEEVWAQVESLQTSLAKAYSMTVEEGQSPREQREKTQIEKLKAKLKDKDDELQDLQDRFEALRESITDISEENDRLKAESEAFAHLREGTEFKRIQELEADLEKMTRSRDDFQTQAGALADQVRIQRNNIQRMQKANGKDQRTH